MQSGSLMSGWLLAGLALQEYESGVLSEKKNLLEKISKLRDNAPMGRDHSS
jgi:hypothetical protein